MPFNKLTIPVRPEIAEAVLTADSVFSFLGRLFYPLALMIMLGSGFFLKYWPPQDGWNYYPAVRSLHILAGLVIMLVGLFRLLAGAVKRWPRFLARVRKGEQRMAWGLAFLEGLYWMSFILLVFSGAAHFSEGWMGVSQPLLRPAFGWGMLHGLVGVYFTAFLLLRWSVWGRAGFSALKVYLYRP